MPDSISDQVFNAASPGERFKSKLLHAVVLGFLKRYTAEDLREMARNDEKFLRFADNRVVSGFQKAVTPALLSHKQDEVSSMLTYKFLLEQAEDHRPDLLPALFDPMVVEWIERQLNEARKEWGI